MRPLATHSVWFGRVTIQIKLQIAAMHSNKRRNLPSFGLNGSRRGWMKNVEHHAGGKGARGMALMRSDMKHLARLQDVDDAGDGKLEGAAQQQRPLLVQVGVIGDHGARCDVNPALRDVVRVDVAAEVAGSDLARGNGGEVE